MRYNKKYKIKTRERTKFESFESLCIYSLSYKSLIFPYKQHEHPIKTYKDKLIIL